MLDPTVFPPRSSVKNDAAGRRSQTARERLRTIFEAFPYVAVGIGVTGAVLVALNIGVTGYGFVLFLISSLLWGAAGWLQRDASLSNVALAEKVNVSPPTCLRRVKRLIEGGWIERQVAVLSTDRLAATLGHGLTALVEVSLDKQGSEHMDAFEARAVAHDAVQQCWRVSPGPDFMLVLQARDMPQYKKAGRYNGSYD